MIKTNLFFNFYKDNARQHEIDYCLKQNEKVFDRVVIVQGRPTFSQLFELTKQYPNDINCFCNSDIFFTEIESLKSIKENECYALARWDLKGNMPYFINRVDSQDAWVFKGVVNNVEANFTMGKWGCDNRLAYEIQKAGYKVTNPSLSIKTIHVHAIDNRNHKRTEQNTIPPPYLTIKPSFL